MLLLVPVSRAVLPPASPESSPALRSRMGWPLFFEPISRDTQAQQGLLARGPNYQLLVSPKQLDFLLRKPSLAPARNSVRRDESIGVVPADLRALRITFLLANRDASLSGTGELEGKVNYLVGNDPARWRTQVPVFARAEVRSLYEGVDLIYYGHGQQLEYDFTIAPKADPSVIGLHFDGADRLTLNSQGELIVAIGDAELRQHPPIIYQSVRGVRREVAGGYRLTDDRTVSFSVGLYDHDYPLVIDPVFSYSTYFGGNGGDTGLSIKVGKDGSVYLAGETLSTQFPPAQITAPFQSQFHGGSVTGDAFVAKFDNTGSHLLYLTYLGGSTDDGAYDMAIDPSGNVYLTGFTVSADFPTHNAIFPQISGSPDGTFHIYPFDAFVTELNTNGSALVFSTYLGGSDKDLGSGIALDAAGNVYVAGYTYSTNFPVVNSIQSTFAGIDDVFIAKLAPGGTRLLYATYLGGHLQDEAEGIAVDAAGYAYVTGYTASTDFPVTTGAFQTNLNLSGATVSVFDAFVARLTPNGKGLVYSTFLGGSQNDFGYRIATDGSGDAFVAGTTQSIDFPHTNAFDLTLGENGTNAVNFDAFFTRLGPAGYPRYSAQFGGNDNDIAWYVALDPSGRAFVVGITLSTNFPVVKPFDLFSRTNSGGKDVFVVAFDTNAAPVFYSGYLGGSGDDFGYAIAADIEANAYISGMTFSAAFPTTPGAPQRSLKGSNDAFLAKIRLVDPMLAVAHSDDTFEVEWAATAPDYSLQSTTDLSAPQVWTTVSQAALLTNGQYLVTVATTNAATLFRLVRH